MKILVPLKPILNPAGLTVNRKAGKVFVNKENYQLNPASKCALEAALRIKDSEPAEVIAASIASFGAAQAADCLREARAMGADRAFLITGDAIDSAGVVRVLVALINHLGGVDLVLNGHRTLDTGASSGAWLAEALGWPCLTEAVACSLTGNVVRIVRPESKNYFAYETDLPAVVTITPAGPPPRYAHGGDIIRAYRDPNAYETLTLNDLNLTEADLQTVTAERGQSFPPEREFGKQVTVADVAALIR